MRVCLFRIVGASIRVMSRDGVVQSFLLAAQEGTISSVSDIVDAVVYLTEARNVTGEMLHESAARTPANGKP